MELELKGGGSTSRSTVPEASHFLLAICFALGLMAARFLLHALVFKPLAGIILVKYGAAKEVTGESKIVKCCESMWKLTYYVSTQLWVVSIMLQQSWWQNTQELFHGWPDQEMDSSLKLFYMCQCGFYLYSIVALLTWETRRKDFPIMMSHHIITSVLIASSFLTRLFRIGTIILALHDTSEVFMEAAKIFKYSENEIGASLCFGLFAISWIIMRLVFFPYLIIKAFSYDLLQVIDSFPWSLFYAFDTMLITLQIFHIYWWKLICAMIMNLIGNKGKVGEDVRSDSEGED